MVSWLQGQAQLTLFEDQYVPARMLLMIAMPRNVPRRTSSRGSGRNAKKWDSRDGTVCVLSAILHKSLNPACAVTHDGVVLDIHPPETSAAWPSPPFVSTLPSDTYRPRCR